MTRRLFFVLLSLMIAIPLLAQQAQPRSGEQKPIVVKAEKLGPKVVYRVDSKPVSDLLVVLNRLQEQRGSDCPVIVLIDPRVPIEQIWGVDGAAGKAQFKRVRFLCSSAILEKCRR